MQKQISILGSNPALIRDEIGRWLVNDRLKAERGESLLKLELYATTGMENLFEEERMKPTLGSIANGRSVEGELRHDSMTYFHLQYFSKRIRPFLESEKFY